MYFIWQLLYYTIHANVFWNNKKNVVFESFIRGWLEVWALVAPLHNILKRPLPNHNEVTGCWYAENNSGRTFK